MTERIGSIVIISPEPDRKCEYCGTVTECRPYGRRGEQICCECAQKPENRAVTESHLDALFGSRH